MGIGQNLLRDIEEDGGLIAGPTVQEILKKLEMSKLETCHHCGEQKENCFHGFIAMCIPIPEAEAQKQKWGGKDWWKSLERTDITPEEFEELDRLNMYDQLLNTVGRGVQCDDCGKKEAELYEIYYPKSLES